MILIYIDSSHLWRGIQFGWVLPLLVLFLFFFFNLIFVCRFFEGQILNILAQYFPSMLWMIKKSQKIENIGQILSMYKIF
jgi:ABC-type multidrug transport system permease subunit